MSGEKGNLQKLTKIIFETNFSKSHVIILILYVNFGKFCLNGSRPRTLQLVHCWPLVIATHYILPLKIVYIEKIEERWKF